MLLRSPKRQLRQAARASIFAGISLALTACGTTRLAYDSKPYDPDRAASLVEQVIMEQHPKYRPGHIEFHPDYFEIDNGSVTSSRSSGFGVPLGGGVVMASGHGKGRTKHLVNRVYYNSIGPALLGKRRAHYVVSIVNKDRRIIQRVYIKKIDTAQEFIDAIDSLAVKK